MADISSLNFPADLLYTPDHEWVKIEGDIATIGVTDFAQSELGDIVFVDVNTLGQTLGAGDVFGTVEAVKTVSDLYLPIAGEMLELNPALEANPELVNGDPYGQGWMVKVNIGTGADTSHLLDAAAYQDLLANQ
jgi:glycine cleavage system H protein